MSLDSDSSGMGSVTTDAFVAPAESLWVNYLALVPGSSLAVEVLNDDGKYIRLSIHHRDQSSSDMRSERRSSPG